MKPGIPESGYFAAVEVERDGGQKSFTKRSSPPVRS